MYFFVVQYNKVHKKLGWTGCLKINISNRLICPQDKIFAVYLWAKRMT
jgi:hypothetical protein